MTAGAFMRTRLGQMRSLPYGYGAPEILDSYLCIADYCQLHPNVRPADVVRAESRGQIAGRILDGADGKGSFFAVPFDSRIQLPILSTCDDGLYLTDREFTHLWGHYGHPCIDDLCRNGLIPGAKKLRSNVGRRRIMWCVPEDTHLPCLGDIFKALAEKRAQKAARRAEEMTAAVNSSRAVGGMDGVDAESATLPVTAPAASDPRVDALCGLVLLGVLARQAGRELGISEAGR